MIYDNASRFSDLAICLMAASVAFASIVALTYRNRYHAAKDRLRRAHREAAYWRGEL